MERQLLRMVGVSLLLGHLLLALTFGSSDSFRGVQRGAENGSIRYRAFGGSTVERASSATSSSEC